MSERVLDNPDASRYELWLDDRLVGRVDYVRMGGVVVMTHAEVEPELRNRGLGERLVRSALEDVAAQGGSVRPLCPFVAAVVRRRPEYRRLLA